MLAATDPDGCCSWPVFYAVIEGLAGSVANHTKIRMYPGRIQIAAE